MAGPAISYGPDGITIDVAQFPLPQQTVASKVINAANAAGVDPNFATSIAHAESGLDQNSTSSKGAVGVMQLMPKTAKALGVNAHDVDDNIKGGIAYQKQLLDMFGGNQQLAAAAYNAGPEAVLKHGGVPPYPETQAYVAKVTGNSKPSEPPDDVFSSNDNHSLVYNGPAEPPDELFANDSKPGQSQQTPGYQKAYGTFSTALNAQPETGLSGMAGQFSNAFTSNLIPALSGGAAALGTGLANFLHNKLGLGKQALGFNMGEAYNAARQAQSDKLSSFAAKDPATSLAAQIGGFATSPVTKALAVAAPAKALPYIAKAVGSKAAPYVASALGAGLTGVTAGAGQGVSEGHDAAQVGKDALITGAASAPFGALGEGAHAFGGLIKSPVGRTIAPVLARTVFGGLGAGALTYAMPEFMGGRNISNAELAAATFGGGLGVGKIAALEKASETRKPPTPNEHIAGAQHIANTTAGGNLELAAQQLEKAPNQNHTALETLEHEHKSSIMQTVGSEHPENLKDVKTQVATRQEAPKVKAKLQKGISKATGSNPEASKDVLENMQERQQQALVHKAENLTTSVPEAIGDAVGINPTEAQSSWEDVAENRRNTVSSPLWKKVDTTAPVDTSDHAHLLESEPVVRQIMARVKADLGPEAEVPNPDYKEPVLKTASDISDEEYKAYLDDVAKGKAPRPEGNWPTHEDVADYLNKNNPEVSNEPETLPTQKAWILAERYLRKMIPRNAFNRVDYSNPRTLEIEKTYKDVNNTNKEHFEGLTEAKESSGEDLASEKANEMAFDFNPKSLNGESAEKFNARYDKLSDMQKMASKHGYLERFFQKFRENPNATANEYLNSDQHQKVMEHMFGERGTSVINEQLKGAQETLKQAAKGGEIAETRKIAQQAVNSKSNSIADFDRNFGEHNQQIYKHEYLNKVQNAINELPKNGTITEQHLSALKEISEPNNYEHHIQDKIFGKEDAEKMRQVIRNEIASAKSGREVAEFDPKAKNEHEALTEATSGAFGFISRAAQGVKAGTKGALIGIAGARGLKIAKFVGRTIHQGDMTPGAHSAVGEILSKSPAEAAKLLRDAAIQKRNIKLSNSALRDNMLRRGALGVGLTTGSHVANAFSGIDNNNGQ